MKKLLGFIMALTFVLTLSACGGDRTAMGYGLVHGHYVGIVEITVDRNGVVTELTLDEYFLPYSWAKVDAEYAENDDVLAVVGARATAYYAEQVTIGDKTFTGTVTGEEGSQGIVYSSEGIADLEEWLKVEANSKWYVEQIDAGNWGFVNEDYETVESDASSVSLIKSESGYWPEGGRGLGWQANVDAHVEAMIGLNLSESFDLTQDEDGFWHVNDTATGATWSDFEDYWDVVVRAYNNAVE